MTEAGTWRFEPKFEQLGWAGDGRMPYADGGRWGFVDLDGNIVIEATYDFVHAFAGGVACVERAGQWQAIDRDGATAASWRSAPSEGRARTSNLWPTRERFEPGGPGVRFGYADEAGGAIVEPRYARAASFRRGRAACQRPDANGLPLGQWEYLDRDGNVVIGPFDAVDARSFGDDDLARVKGTTWRFIALDGSVVLETGFTEVSPVREGLASVAGPDKPSKWGGLLRGFIDLSGKLVIERQFEAAAPFSDGLAVVTLHVGPAPTCGYVDREGRIVIEPKFRKAHAFVGALAPACVPAPGAWSSDAWGLIDREGSWRVEPTFAAILPFTDGAARFRRTDGTWGLLDLEGNVIADGYAELASVGYPCAANRGGRLKKNGEITGGKWGFLDANGRELVPCNHPAIGTGFKDGVAAVAG